MSRQADHLENSREVAQRLFLGRGPIVGIGVGGDGDSYLIFLMEEESAEYRQLVNDWSASIGVRASFRITGQNRPSHNIS